MEERLVYVGEPRNPKWYKPGVNTNWSRAHKSNLQLAYISSMTFCRVFRRKMTSLACTVRETQTRLKAKY